MYLFIYLKIIIKISHKYRKSHLSVPQKLYKKVSCDFSRQFEAISYTLRGKLYRFLGSHSDEIGNDNISGSLGPCEAEHTYIDAHHVE